MNDDPGHNVAEQILQTEQDDHYGDMADADKLTSSIAIWTHCTSCCVRRDHIFDLVSQAWRCEHCGVVNMDLTQMRDHPEEG